MRSILPLHFARFPSRGANLSAHVSVDKNIDIGYYISSVKQFRIMYAKEQPHRRKLAGAEWQMPNCVD